ncbi:ATP-binding cassette domain-containing protein [Pseudooceanicola sp. GBMRC 2024]|uniref:ATP-binding cassette domain-containing protein n=1 Tax=Pseudooceanicola albus TaxID=2692189 RepID=A0A6L7G375_9RHOB|nr:ABC transporter ATP-binding protein [Pseudooceanicola albus]MXN17958.1 ATP-binding cassette domain-containing protein [Pseudooceanicola albus]
MTATPLLEVRDLRTQFDTRLGPVVAVEDISLTLQRGEILGLVGESGSGKSVTGFSLMGLIDAPGRVAGGQILFDGSDLAGLPEKGWRALRGKRIAMIFQDPMMTLNPVLRIDTQMIETVRAHEKISRSEARARAREALVQVGIPAPDERLESYPHQFSGGMRQRVAIAIALLHKPDLIIADEPTTALDVTIQAQILAQVQRLCRDTGTALIWITHDLAVVSGLADRVAVMYSGRIVEEGPTAQVISHPAHPYTRGLIDSVPHGKAHQSRLQQISGMAPSLLEPPPGCRFAPRCRHARPACDREPALLPHGADRRLRCLAPLDQDQPQEVRA